MQNVIVDAEFNQPILTKRHSSQYVRRTNTTPLDRLAESRQPFSGICLCGSARLHKQSNSTTPHKSDSSVAETYTFYTPLYVKYCFGVVRTLWRCYFFDEVGDKEKKGARKGNR